jgi:aerobic-type carbon monoxide dehydrogenase small subunit (CoxS/CutS family)
VCSALDKHLCRCGSHPRIIRAVMKALHEGQRP